MRRVTAEATLALGVQLPLGVAVGLAWAHLSPNPPAVWAGTVWAAESDFGFRAAADAWFAVLGAGVGLVVGIYLTLRARQSRPLSRLAWWLAGAMLGSGTAYLTGLLVTGSMGVATEVGQMVAAAPLNLTALGAGLAWPVVAMAVTALATALRALFARQ